jgi:hypothetical protein
MIAPLAIGNTGSKGFTLLGALAFVEARFGEEAKWKLAASVDEETHGSLVGAILPSGWYPFRTQVSLYEAIDRVFGKGDLEMCREIGKLTCDYEMKSIHKVYLKLASLELWVRSSGLMWGRYYSEGRLEVQEIGETEGALRIVDFDPLSKAFCYDFGGWLHRTLELNKREDVTVEHPECVPDGADACSYVGRWSRRK